jgi:hypothetical protein
MRFSGQTALDPVGAFPTRIVLELEAASENLHQNLEALDPDQPSAHPLRPPRPIRIPCAPKPAIPLQNRGSQLARLMQLRNPT